MTTIFVPASQTMNMTMTRYAGGDITAGNTGSWASSLLALLGLLGLHAGLGLAMHQWPFVATAHGWIVGLIALIVAFDARPGKVAMIGGYIVGSDVLWRMTGAVVFWEYAKYLLVLAFLIAIVRGRAGFVWRFAPIAYFSLLIPSVSVVLGDPKLDTFAIRSALSFGLSGPLALAIAIWLLSQVTLSHIERRKVFILCIAPLVGIAALTLMSTYSATEIKWTTQSNFVTSDGFGPNQISTVLGLGALLAFLISIDPRTSRPIRWLMTGTALLLLTQAVMTFSRGGVYSVVIGATLFSVTLLLSRRGRTKGGSRGVVLLIALSVVFIGAILPRLDQFTGGALETRLRETTTSGRDELVRDDLRLWSEHPLLGVGPGTSQRHRIDLVAGSHTEYTRLLAEHGLLGALALLILSMMCVARLLRARDAGERALVIGLMSWSLVTMAHATMRTVGPSFILGLAFAAFVPPNIALRRSKPLFRLG